MSGVVRMKNTDFQRLKRMLSREPRAIEGVGGCLYCSNFTRSPCENADEARECPNYHSDSMASWASPEPGNYVGGVGLVLLLVAAAVLLGAVAADVVVRWLM